MPETAITSWTKPASPFADSCAAAFAEVACPFVVFTSFPLLSSHVADCLLKNSEEDSRFTAVCFVRAMDAGGRGRGASFDVRCREDEANFAGLKT